MANNWTGIVLSSSSNYNIISGNNAARAPRAENLNIKSMIREKFGKQINDAGWGMLASMLCHKAESAGCKVVFVNPEGTTQQCSRCGIIVPKTLADRVHNCLNCGLVLDRDLNAAHNILRRSAVGHTEPEACEVTLKGVTMKQEAHTYS
jgi:putative transposase